MKENILSYFSSLDLVIPLSPLRYTISTFNVYARIFKPVIVILHGILKSVNAYWCLGFVHEIFTDNIC